MLMKTVWWRPVAGFEGLYEVSNYGDVKRLNGYSYYTDSIGRKCKRFVKEKKLRLADVNKYKRVCLCKNGEHFPVLVHIIMMQAFVPNPHNYPCINHKDENPSNNFIYVNPDGSVDLEKSNLEWCTFKYNSNYGTASKRIAEKLSKEVLQYSIDGVLIKKWNSLSQIKQVLGFDIGNISNSINGNISTKYPYGFKWAYS